MPQDSSEIDQLLKGDPVLISKLYSHTFPLVERYIVSHGGSKKDAEDFFHNALVILFVKIKEGRLNIQSFDKYLFTVCRNMWRRENEKKRVTNLENIPLISEDIDLASFYVEQEQWELYKEKFDKLSTSCKEILKMALKKIPYEEIVRTFKYTSQTVARQRVFKCKAKLIQLIKKDKKYDRLKQ